MRIPSALPAIATVLDKENSLSAQLVGDPAGSPLSTLSGPGRLISSAGALLCWTAAGARKTPQTEASLVRQPPKNPRDGGSGEICSTRLKPTCSSIAAQQARLGNQKQVRSRLGFSGGPLVCQTDGIPRLTDRWCPHRWRSASIWFRYKRKQSSAVQESDGKESRRTSPGRRFRRYSG